MNRKEILYYVYIFSIVSATTFLSLHILETRSISGQIIEDDILDLGEINNNIDLGDKLTRRIEKKEKMTDFVVDREKNSYGFHDEEWKKQKDNDTYRIVAIGDSFTEGSYVKGNNTWPSRLEEILNKRQNSTNFEVLNMAKGGNFIYEKYSIFQNYTLDFNPDMVILQYYHNDWRNRKDTKARQKFKLWENGKYELPDKIEKKIDEENLSEDTIVSIIDRIEFRKYIKQANKGEEWDKKVKPRLKKIANICEQKNITFIIVTWDSPDWQVKRIEEITERYNVPFYDFSDKLPMTPRKYRLPDDHLNSLGYEVVANETYRHLKDMI